MEVNTQSGQGTDVNGGGSGGADTSNASVTQTNNPGAPAGFPSSQGGGDGSQGGQQNGGGQQQQGQQGYDADTIAMMEAAGLDEGVYGLVVKERGAQGAQQWLADRFNALVAASYDDLGADDEQAGQQAEQEKAPKSIADRAKEAAATAAKGAPQAPAELTVPEMFTDKGIEAIREQFGDETADLIVKPLAAALTPMFNELTNLRKQVGEVTGTLTEAREAPARAKMQTLLSPHLSKHPALAAKYGTDWAKRGGEQWNARYSLAKKASALVQQTGISPEKALDILLAHELGQKPQPGQAVRDLQARVRHRAGQMSVPPSVSRSGGGGGGGGGPQPDDAARAEIRRILGK